MLYRLTYSDAAHAADSSAGASTVVRPTVRLGQTFAQTRPAGLRGILTSWTCRMIDVRGRSITCGRQ